MSDRPLADELVYDALLEFGIGGGDYTANISDLATVAGISQAQTTRSLQSLVEQGALEFTGRRRGRTAIWRRGSKRLASSGVGPRNAQAVEPPTGVSTDHGTNPGAADGQTPPEAGLPASGAMLDEARQSEEAALVENSRIQGYDLLDALYADGDDEQIGAPDLDGGECGECGHAAHARWLHGTFALCRECRRRRARATAKLEADGQLGKRRVTVDADAAADLVEALVESATANGNGNGQRIDDDDDPFGLLEEAPY